MKKAIPFIVKLRPAMAVVFIITLPLSIPYIIFGLIVKEKLTVREKIALFFLLAIYLGAAVAINLAGCPGDRVLWTVFVLVMIAGIAEDIVRDRRNSGEDES